MPKAAEKTDEKQTPKRDARGYWLPGQSANPGGRPAASYRISELAKTHSPKMLQVLVDVAIDATAPPSARVAAASAVLDRAHGKPVQSLEAKIETIDFSAMHLAALRNLAGIKNEDANIIDVSPTVT
jgi:hypothetical protein